MNSVKDKSGFIGVRGMMVDKKFHLSILVAGFLLALSLPAPLAEGGEELIRDSWNVTKMAGDETGWAHEKILKVEKDGEILFKTVTIAQVEMKRLGQTIKIESEGWSLETEDGKVLGMHQKTIMSGSETLYDVEVKGDKAILTVTTMGKARPSTIPWDENVIGPMGIHNLRNRNGFAKGTKYSFKQFITDYTKVVTFTVEILGKEETELLDGKKAKLIHTVGSMDLIPGVKQHEWWNDEAVTMKTSMSMMSILIESYHTTEKRAMTKMGGGELKADMLLESMARSNVNLPNPYGLDSILYQFEVKDKDIGMPDSLDDLRQKVVENNGTVARVLIRAVKPTSPQKRPLANPSFEMAEYLEANAFLQCDDPALKAKALEVVGSETDAWKAACILEHFVYEYITDKNFGTGFASASEVFQDRTGDCSEHGVLLAAFCRAAGIPARVAMGYMYLGGIFGGHMWTEVWINGGWYAIDGVMGIGRVDPTHITFTTSSLKNGALGESFVKAIQGLGNLKITIQEFKRGSKVVKVGKAFKDYVIEGNTYTNTLYNISITKPDNCEFTDYERDFSELSFGLVRLKGKTKIKVRALPAAFSFTLDSLKDALKEGGIVILSEEPRKINGREGRLFKGKDGGRSTLVLGVIDQDTCFTFSMKIEDEWEDGKVFEKVVNSIRFK
jgi:hypothetical protein